jgi:Excalibur calcium-binding domain
VIRAVLVGAATAVAIAGVGGVTAPIASAGPPYASCEDAAKDGRYNIPKGDPAYSSKLDRDGDGIACEA